MTQQDMATLLGISRQAYSDKERMIIPFKQTEMKKIRDIYRNVNPDITVDDIFFAKK